MANTALNRTSGALLTNKSGGALNYGDVVVLDNTNANGFTTTTTSGLDTRGLGVIGEPNGIANNATGFVVTAGWCPQVNLNTAATVGQFIKTHTVAGQATPHSSPQVGGDFGVVLAATATPPAILFGSAHPSSAGTVTNTGTLTSGVLIQGNGGSDVTVNATTATVTKLTAGTPSAATDGTDYLSPSTGWTKIPAALLGGGANPIVTSGSAATVDFSTIPGTYTSLKVVWQARDTTAGTGSNAMFCKVNNDGTAGNYTASSRIGSQNGTAFATTAASTGNGVSVANIPTNGNTAGETAAGELTVANYAATTFHKRVICTFGQDDDAANGLVATYTARWKSTAAVTRLTFTPNTAFVDGSTFTLYGLP